MTSDAEVVKAGFEVAFSPVKEFFLRLLGPAADELGGIVADPIRAYRFKQSIRLLEKVKRICEETGFQPKAVPLKTLLPILENASLEEDEDLHTIWANLLANAADPRHPGILPSFIEVLKQLSRAEAIFLSRFYDGARKLRFSLAEMFLVWRQDSNSKAFFMVSMEDLQRLNLIEMERDTPSPDNERRHKAPAYYSWTTLGLSFVQACRAPQKAE